jgi:hypothetical protein
MAGLSADVAKALLRREARRAHPIGRRGMNGIVEAGGEEWAEVFESGPDGGGRLQHDVESASDVLE